MNVLFLTDSFSNGGLETHIIDLSQTLSNAGHNAFIAHGSEYDDGFFQNFRGVLANLSLRYDSMAGQTVDTIDLLCSFIDEHQISVIHAHPFYSFVVGAVIADRKNIPLICTIHGPGSVDGAPGDNARALWPRVVSNSHVIAVSHELGEIFSTKFGFWPDVQPNTAKRTNVSVAPKGHRMIWAGRLDGDKTKGLYALLDTLDSLPNWELDIAGEGPEIPNLLKAISGQASRQGRIRLLGWIDDIQTHMPKYDIVAGMGRVIVEASSLAIPSLLVGYDEVKFFMSSSTVDDAAVANFSGRSVSSSPINDVIAAINTEEFLSYGREMNHWVEVNRSPEAIGNRYVASVLNAKPFQNGQVREFFELLSSSTDKRASSWYDRRFLPTPEGALE